MAIGKVRDGEEKTVAARGRNNGFRIDRAMVVVVVVVRGEEFQDFFLHLEKPASPVRPK